jgi:hypothetical protein
VIGDVDAVQGRQVHENVGVDHRGVEALSGPDVRRVEACFRSQAVDGFRVGQGQLVSSG